MTGDGAAAPRAGGGGGGSSDPRAGSDDGFRCRSHGVRAGSARIDRVGLAQAWRRSAMSHARRRLCEATAVQDCGHTAARRVLRRRRVRRSAAAGRCGTAGSSGAELGRCLVPFGATFGISLSRTERLLLVHRLSFWLNCCCCCLLPRSGSIAAVRNIRRRAAASLQPSSTGQEHRGYVALATLHNRLL